MKEVRKRKKCLNKLRNPAAPSRLCFRNIPDSSYPFLTLLEEICLLIQTNDVKEDIETDIIKDNSHCENIPIIDKTLYPFSSLLQNFIHEARLHNRIIAEKVNSYESLLYNMNSIGPSFDDSYQWDKENLNSDDYSYASRLKHLACQSEKIESTDNRIHKNCESDISDIRYILQRTFPSREHEPDDMTFSRKLQSLSENVVQGQKNADTSHSTCQNFYEQTNDDISNFINIKNCPHYLETTTIGKNHITTDGINKEFSYMRPTFKDKHLFDALMNNVHMQSLINHGSNPEQIGSTVIKTESAINELGETENFLLQHIHKNNWEI